MNVDPKQADQNIRDTLVLPAGSGKAVRVAVMTEDVAAAKDAGADMAGTDDLLAQFEKGQMDFDVLVSTPQLMPKLGKYARVLGPAALCQTPRAVQLLTISPRPYPKPRPAAWNTAWTAPASCTWA